MPEKIKFLLIYLNTCLSCTKIKKSEEETRKYKNIILIIMLSTFFHDV